MLKKLQFSGPCDLRPPILPTKYGLILEVVLQERYICIESIRLVSQNEKSSLKMEGILKSLGLKLQGPLYMHSIW